MLGKAQTTGTEAAVVPSGFEDRAVFSGLTHPTNIAFASDGRVFVAEKSGLIKVFDSLTDTTPTIFADLRSEVDDYWDRGLLGLALAPTFPAEPVRLRPVHVRRADRRHARPSGATPARPRPGRRPTAAS